MKHIIESQQFDRRFIRKIFSSADRLSKKTGTPLKGKIMAVLFYEPSTRTRFSFESAMIRLGGNVITTENAKELSSVSKGETLEDTIRVISNYVDIIVMRHYEEGTSERATLVSGVPIINAGDGVGQHPTQALLDLYTIWKGLKKIDGLHIAFIGDLKHGRTIRSLSYLLGKYKHVHISFVSPKALRVGDDIKTYLEKNNITYTETDNLSIIIAEADVLYQTRIQQDRFSSAAEYKKYKGRYQIDMKTVKRMKKASIIMHPLPRVDEILPEVDASPKALYFKQAHYGLLIRMALLKYIFES